MPLDGKYQILATTENEVVELFTFLKENQGITWASGNDLLGARSLIKAHLPCKFIHIGYRERRKVTHSDDYIEGVWEFDGTVDEFLAVYRDSPNVEVNIDEYL